MSIKVTFNGSTLLTPGAYTKTIVNLNGGFPLADRGIVGIVGEAESGAPGSTTGEGVQTYTSSQIQSLVDYYGSGPIVDAARALINPSRDARVPNGAQTIRVYKTNNSGQATNTVKNIDTVTDTLFDIDALNYGASGNNTNFYISDGSVPDYEPTVVSDSAITFPLTITNADTLVITVGSTTHTMTLAGTASGTFSQAQTVALLNGAVTNGLTPTWTASPGGVLVQPFIFAASGTTKVSCTINPLIITAYSNLHEYAVLSVTTSSLKTALVLTSASTVNSTTLAVTAGGAGPVRGYRGTRIFTISNNGTTESMDENSNDVYMTIYYTGAGSASVMNIKMSAGSKYLTTTCTGAASDDLSIKLSDYTIAELVDLINNHASYTCITSYGNASVRNAAWLDFYDAINIKTLPLELKGVQLEIQDIVNAQSQLVTLEAKNDVYGQIETILSTAKRYLAGGSKGFSTNANFQAGFDALLNYRCNTVIPCISRDATSDIADGYTDASSTYLIASVIAQADAHCRLASNTKNRSERNCYIGYKTTFAASITKAKSINSEFTTMLIQDVDTLDTDGTIVTKQPHVLASMCAGMQSGTEVGEPITFKYINAYGVSHTDYDVKQDIDTAIEAGICVVDTPDAGGYRVVLGNTTYGKDQNFTFNRISVMEVAHYTAYNLRQQLESIFVGSGRQRATTSAQSVYSITASILSSFTNSGILVPDEDNNYRGYKNLTVSVNGNTVSIDVTITPVQGIEFILGTITLDQIRDTAI